MVLNKIARYYDILSAQKHAGRFIASRVLMRTGASKIMKIHREGYSLKFHPSALTAAFWVNQGERTQEERFLRSFVKSGDVVIDVGANIGSVSLSLSAQMDGIGKVYAFEPHPRIFEFLKENVELNNAQSCIQAHCIALGKEHGVVEFSDQSDDSNNAVLQGGKGLQVPVERLDDIVPQEQKIALLKIDVEGYEYQVLQGARETCRMSSIVYLECISKMLEANGASETMICNLLEDLGFKIFQVVGNELIENTIGSHKKKMILARKKSTPI